MYVYEWTRLCVLFGSVTCPPHDFLKPVVFFSATFSPFLPSIPVAPLTYHSVVNGQKPKNLQANLCVSFSLILCFHVFPTWRQRMLLLLPALMTRVDWNERRRGASTPPRYLDGEVRNYHLLAWSLGTKMRFIAMFFLAFPSSKWTVDWEDGRVQVLCL